MLACNRVLNCFFIHRKAAKSLTTLFDKDALQHLSSQEETKTDLMNRFFTSISPMYGSGRNKPTKRKKRLVK